MTSRAISPRRTRWALATAIVLASATAATAAADAGAFGPGDFHVFIDRPTGFSYIRTPDGWKFIRKLDPARVQAARELKRQGTPGITIADIPAAEPER